MTQTMKQFKNGLVDQNPTLVLMLGICPALAASSAMTDAAGMGISTMAVLICSNFTVSALRKFIPEKIRIAVFMTVIAAYVTAADYLLQAFAPALSHSLGVFIPLIVVNCIVFARAEVFAYHNGIGRSALDGLAMGMGFLAALMAVACIRELLSAGTLFELRILPESFPAFAIMARPPGGFFALGMVLAITQAVRGKARGAV